MDREEVVGEGAMGVRELEVAQVVVVVGEEETACGVS